MMGLDTVRSHSRALEKELTDACRHVECSGPEAL